MQFRKTNILFLATLILFSNLGLAINVHYCKDKIAGISFTTQIEEICIKDEKSCCKVEKTHDNCCSNKVIKAQEKNDTFLSDYSKIDFHSLYFVHNTSLSLSKNNVFVSKKEIVSFYCDSNAPTFYKLYCQLVLYA
ncbi:HYC_CC_PP family protein [Flavobacterium sp.]|jgi:hypothetical protein|uniref:HYC_CC_PP family protein n=1 Tax=Flavobacterium sp. TaxID=239 RepID=UPI002A821BF7|nr:hypothetical protein [Flavobacterium sp.]